MAMSNFDDVGIFHEKFDLDNSTCRSPGPRAMDPSLILFRIKFMQEELAEFIEGYEEDPENHAKMADALVDLVYVAMGTAHLLGYPWQALWEEVQEANLRKRRAATADESKRGSTHDVVKPPGWTPPAIEAIMQSWGWE